MVLRPGKTALVVVAVVLAILATALMLPITIAKSSNTHEHVVKLSQLVDNPVPAVLRGHELWNREWEWRWREYAENITRIVNETLEDVEKVIEKHIGKVVRVIENVTESVGGEKHYENRSVVFRHGCNCSRAKLFLKKAALVLNATSEFIHTVLNAVKAVIACRGRCAFKHALVIANSSLIIAEEAVLENTTLICNNCTIIGKLVAGELTRLILINPNMTLCNMSCVNCSWIYSMYNTSEVKAAINHTKAWLVLGKANPLLHNHTVVLEVETPGVNLSLTVETRWCLDNYTVVCVKHCVNETCRTVCMNYNTCRPIVNLAAETKHLELTVYHGFYDMKHSILVHVNSTRIITNYTAVRPTPGLLAVIAVDAPSGCTSIITLENLSAKPYMVMYVKGLPTGNVTPTVIPEVDPEDFTRCLPCWTWLNGTVLIKVMHSSPVTVLVTESEQQLAQLGFKTLLLIALAVAIAVAIIIAVVVTYRRRQRPAPLA